VASSQPVQELDILVAGGGFDQIMIAAGKYLEAKMDWTVNNVQIGLGDGASQLIADGGSSIGAFKFDGAKGLFILPGGAKGGTTTWSTSASSSTTAQIWIAGGMLDVKSTGKCTSTFGAVDVWVGYAGTLKFDYDNGLTVSDLFDNNNDNAGYIYVGCSASSGLGTVTTSNKAFDVANKMPIRNTGNLTVDTAELDFYGSVAGANNTNGYSYFMTTDVPGRNPPAPTTTLKNGAVLLCDEGYVQGYGTLATADGTPVTVTSNLAGDSSVYFLGGTIAFPGGTTYGTIKFAVPTGAGANFDIGAVTMNVDPFPQGRWIADQISTNGYFNFPAGSSMSLTINNTGGLVQPGSATLLYSSNNLPESGTWGTVTNNVAGTTPAWNALGDYWLSKAVSPSWSDRTLVQFLVSSINQQAHREGPPLL
jgi:hypothetical protein